MPDDKKGKKPKKGEKGYDIRDPLPGAADRAKPGYSSAGRGGIVSPGGHLTDEQRGEKDEDKPQPKK